jgi:DNA-binding Lrp family transcriptional regulator
VTYVAGVYDIIVRISSDNMDKLREIIKMNIKKIDKVRSTITMVVTDGQGQKK